MKKNTKHKCPCCGKLTINVPGDYEICEICGWEDDPVQRKDKSFTGGANELSLNEARTKWKAKAVVKNAKGSIPLEGR